MPREIVLAVETSATPLDVFGAVTTEEGLAAFWTSDVDARLELGAELRLGFADAPVDLNMIVTAFEAPHRVEWECPGPWPSWAGTRIEWSIADGQPTTVLFAHRGWADTTEGAELGSVAMAWARILLALVSYVETGESAPALG